MDDFSNILQLPMTAVRERIEQELQENPVLELRCSEDTDAAPDDETADIIVDRSGAGRYDVRLPDHRFSDLFISQRYPEMCQDPALEPRAKEYLGRQLRRAQCFLEAVEQRREILKKVAEAIFRQQDDFFDHGPSHIAPLYVEQVAGEVGVDALKVRRTIQGKQVRTRYGVFALDRFVLRQPPPSIN
jgi:RNA polymerase sigma-54 factor